MSELFPISDVTAKSPRLRWLEKHWVGTGRDLAVEDNDEPYFACFLSDGIRWWGETEDDALVALAKANGLKLWFEETP